VGTRSDYHKIAAWLAKAFDSKSSIASTNLPMKFNLQHRSNMRIFLLISPQVTTLFYKKICYSEQLDDNHIVFYAYFFYKYLIIQLSSNACQSPNHMQKDFLMIINFSKLLQNSLKLAPNMPSQYHIETLLIAARFIGGSK